ncbi:hypothetical protein D3C87_397490 [compost metagenome]
MKNIKLKSKFLTTAIPSNTIFCKNQTGIGATYFELNVANRNSLIIVPNVPVIIGKTKGRNDILGVYEGVTKSQIESYLRSRTEHKKIITTPESLSRVIAVFQTMEIDYLNTYFMLIDECDKLTKDIDYRTSITLSLDYFFEFQNKAFVSATALIPSDPRFRKNGFSVHNIIPTYRIDRDINVITTNHSLSSLNKILRQSKADKIFIFLNSVVGPASIIKSLNIEKLSSIFTSSDGVKSFRLDVKDVKPEHISDELDNEKFSKYNFLTSRYFSAVDIDTEENVDIVIISDINNFPHSLIDPSTDILQIVGRLRKKEYVGSINLIAKISSDIQYVSEKSIKDIFAFGRKLRDFLEIAFTSTQNEELKMYIKQLANINSDRAFFNVDFTSNYFMMDNYRLENKALSLYRKDEKLVQAIRNLSVRGTDIRYFNVNHIKEVYNPSEPTVKLISARKQFKDKFEDLITTMESIQKSKKEKSENKFLIDQSEDLERYIVSEYFEMYEVFLNEGSAKVREIGASQKAIKDYYYLNHDNEHLKNTPLLQELYSKFRIGKKYEQGEFLKSFMTVYSRYVPNAKREIQNIEKFYKIKQSRERRNGPQKRMILLEETKFEVSKGAKN